MVRRGYPQRHGSLYHQHHGLSVLAQALWSARRIGWKFMRVKQGWLCPYCGFTPNENARRDSQTFLVKLLARGKKPW